MSEGDRIKELERTVAKLTHRVESLEKTMPRLTAGAVIAIRQVVETLERWRVLPAGAINVALRLYRARLPKPEQPEDAVVRALIELPPNEIVPRQEQSRRP